MYRADTEAHSITPAGPEDFGLPAYRQVPAPLVMDKRRAFLHDEPLLC
jgi:hypothetical protein